MEMLTNLDLINKSKEYNKNCHSNHTVGNNPDYHFLSGAEYVNKHYEKQFEEVKELIYGKEKMSFITSHLLRSFNEDQLISLRDFLISRTPKDEQNNNNR